MNQILVEISVPAMHETMDVYLYPEMQIKDVISIIKDYLTSYLSGNYDRNSNSCLCILPQGQRISENYTVSEAELKNGTRLMFY